MTKPNPEAQTYRTIEHDFALPPIGSREYFFGVPGGARGAMFPDAPKAAFKATTQHGGCGVICEVHPETKIPDFKLSDIPGVRHAD